MMGIPKLGPVIAIDGPAGTGKSTVTRRLAEELHFVHVDTGALYRAIAFLLLEKQPQSHSKLKDGWQKIASDLAKNTHLEFKRVPEEIPANRIFGNGVDLTNFIRTPAVSMAASQVSAIPEVRAALLGLQRHMGCTGKTILEGRDIGTVIFPDADVKFFLTASVEERAKRRLAELEAAGADAPSYEEVKQQIVERDQADSTRAVAPLKKANDAIEVDTSKMTLDEVVQRMMTIANERLSGKPPKR